MATKKTDDVFSLAAFDPAKATETFRDFAEKGAAQSKEAYSKIKAAAEDATKTVEATIENAQSGSVELGLKAIDALRTNAENSLSHLEALPRRQSRFPNCSNCRPRSSASRQSLPLSRPRQSRKPPARSPKP